MDQFFQFRVGFQKHAEFDVSGRSLPMLLIWWFKWHA
jgi:hypothetical protein